MLLKDKKIILAVTGSIAAYKTPQLVRLLVKAGAAVKVIMTDAAMQFVTPLSLSTVSKNPVLHSVTDGSSWNNHVELGLWADALLIAPCSANTLAKLANGLCDTLVNAVYLSARCPVFIAPAMDEDMWIHPSTSKNVQQVVHYGNHIIPVGTGELASGLNGAGRMAEPEDIITFLTTTLNRQMPLKGKKALVTAGPTYEKLDPVRFIGNFSTGKMGIALADTLAEMGASVTLVLGPTHLQPFHSLVETIHVTSAQEMYDACMKTFPGADIAVLSAAVADFTPETMATQKIKKTEQDLTLQLIKTRDILASLGAVKTERQVLVGFALETEHEEEHAAKKLKTKNADYIVLNSLNDSGAGFGHDTNKVTILDKEGHRTSLPLLTKKQTAEAIINLVLHEVYEYETL